jgi:NADP-dependent 3-hydroxy acid dehydrogenase YdfG
MRSISQRGDDMRMTQRLAGTVALVTGASSGIGEATALALAAEGATVAVLARRRDRLTDLTGRIADAGGSALVVEADITDPGAATAAVERVVGELGRLDIVVNNAGAITIGPAAEASTDDWDKMLAINIHGLLYITRASLPHLVAAATDSPRRVADLINISSTGGRIARPNNSIYSLSKFGVGAFTESVRQEMIDKRVRVSVVEPGRVATEIATHLPENVQAAMDAQSAEMELLQPADIADAITYVVTRPRHVAINEILIRAAEQTW